MIKRMKEPELERGEGEDQGVVGEGANRQWPPTSWAKPRICQKLISSRKIEFLTLQQTKYRNGFTLKGFNPNREAVA